MLSVLDYSGRNSPDALFSFIIFYINFFLQMIL